MVTTKTAVTDSDIFANIFTDSDIFVNTFEDVDIFAQIHSIAAPFMVAPLLMMNQSFHKS